MKKNDVLSKIRTNFTKQVQSDQTLKNAYLLVHSDKHEIHLKMAEGNGADGPLHEDQPNYLASVGKLYTSTLTGILHDEGSLSFDDAMRDHLDDDFYADLHVLEGENHTASIKIHHLLNHTSGLYDCFWPMVDKIIHDQKTTMSVKDVLRWGKENKKPDFKPGEGFSYTDTNYYLLGLIIEKVTGMSLPEALRHHIFEPLGMKHSHMLHHDRPMEESDYPIADFLIRGVNLTPVEAYGTIDFGGGCVVSTLEEQLTFMRALKENRLLREETFTRMKNDTRRFSVGIAYGYGIMSFVTVPVLMPKRFNMWGHPGVTGAFSFYHPTLDTYVIGTFNNADYANKGVRFALFKVINLLLKLK